ncbi:mammalian cell entry protein, partial [Pseudomonas sp. MWU12-2534b]
MYSSDLPQTEIRPRSRWIPSLVWIVPLVCALIGLSLVIRTVAATGPTISVTFANAEGLEAGKTKVRYKDVDIGSVQAITLTPDFKRVVVSIQLTRDAARFANRDTRFWVVRPRVGATGISGLGTLLSGAYIGADLGRSQQKQTDFT